MAQTFCMTCGGTDLAFDNGVLVCNACGAQQEASLLVLVASDAAWHTSRLSPLPLSYADCYCCCRCSRKRLSFVQALMTPGAGAGPQTARPTSRPKPRSWQGRSSRRRSSCRPPPWPTYAACSSFCRCVYSPEEPHRLRNSTHNLKAHRSAPLYCCRPRPSASPPGLV